MNKPVTFMHLIIIAVVCFAAYYWWVDRGGKGRPADVNSLTPTPSGSMVNKN